MTTRTIRCIFARSVGRTRPKPAFEAPEASPRTLGIALRGDDLRRFEEVCEAHRRDPMGAFQDDGGPKKRWRNRQASVVGRNELYAVDRCAGKRKGAANGAVDRH